MKDNEQNKPRKFEPVVPMDYGFETLSIHAGQKPDSETGARALPIYATTSFVFEDQNHAADLFSLQTFGNIYSRINNPTVAAFEERMAALEGGIGSVATASGSAALFLAIATLCKEGDQIVSSKSLYGGSYTQLNVSLKRFGIKTIFVDADNPDEVEKAVTKNTKILFAETIANPRCDVCDIESLAKIAKRHGIVLMIDNTVATPALCRPFEWGADVIIHSATKFLGGHGNALGGVLIDSGRFPYNNGNYPILTEPSQSYHGLTFWDNFREYAFLMRARTEVLRDFGPALSPFNAFLIMQGIETLSLRIERHIENAIKLAVFLNDHDLVDWVNYPIFEGNAWKERAQKYIKHGPGSVFAFSLKGGYEAGIKFIKSVELASHLANIGDTRTLVIHPASTTHQQMSKEQREAIEITDGMVRVSVGLETIDDIIRDFKAAIEAKP